MSRSRMSARTFPVLSKPFGVRPAPPQKAECSFEPLPIVSSFFAFVLNSTPAFTKCVPNTRV